MTPDNLLFAKTHEWVRVENDSSGAKVATIGVSAFALEALTDLVYIELPAVGKTVKAGEPFGEIESVKAVSDLYAPVSGEVIASHAELSEKLETLNADPYGEGWMVKVRLRDEAELKGLLDYKAYQKQCAEEQH
ncbi:MAG TPA: glycine cleavage system protein GcvH [Pirellulales bacterium]|nr:glycine cleavage system protein GcvH [Pirellulales bacterium]